MGCLLFRMRDGIFCSSGVGMTSWAPMAQAPMAQAPMAQAKAHPTEMPMIV